MIKLLFIHWKLTVGGAESALFDLVRLLDKKIFDITVFALVDGGEWESKFREAGIKVVNPYTGMIPSKNILGKLRNYFRIKKIAWIKAHDGKGLIGYCTSEKYDVIISYLVFEYCKLAGLNEGVKTIKYIHGNLLTNAHYNEQTIDDTKYLSKFDKIICVSEDAKKSFIEASGRRNGVVGCLNPLYYEDIKIKSLEQVTPQMPELSLIAVGRLVRVKGFTRLITIHKRLLDEGIFHTLYIVGDGPEKETIIQEIVRTGTQDTVQLVGYSDNPYKYMRNCRFLICSSYSEGMSVVSMEAISLGIPVVASVPSVQELFGEECCGIITESDDDSLYYGIRKMLIDEQFYKMAKIGTLRRQEYINSRALIKIVENEYIELV